MIGKQVGHYRIEAEIGAGGMGVVYRARDARLDRAVALKLLPPLTEGDRESRARLLQEARTASALNHPNVCTVFDVGEHEGRPFIAMELVEGEALDQVVSAGALPAEAVIRYGIQIADALDHAHAHGVIHRDLKCANVMVTREGRPKVLDFGLAKRLLDAPTERSLADASLTASGVVVGTPYAIAPEVLRGARADARSDLWALGVLLYELASGARPFEGRTYFELSAAILGVTPPPLPPRVPAGLAAVITRCLAKDPAERHARAGEVRAALEAISVQGPVVSSPAPAERRDPRFAFAAISIVIATAVVALGAFGVRWSRDRARPAPRIRSIAVLPLVDFKHDPGQEFFADGTTEALITQLAQIPALRVTSRTSVMRYRGTSKPIREVARELGVDAVVEGSVERSGDQVRITAQLIEASTNQHLWAKSYVREAKRVMELQDEVARDIARSIQLEIAPRRKGGVARSVDPEVYDLYLKGRAAMNREGVEGVREGIEYFRQVVARDPENALALSGLADAYMVLSQVMRAVSAEDSWPLVREYAGKALALDEGLAEAHTSMGAVKWLSDYDWSGGEREARRAIELNPSYSLAHGVLGMILVAEGRTDEGVAAIQKSVTLDPLSVFTGSNALTGFYLARRFDEAHRQGQRVLELDPKATRVHTVLRRIAELRGDYEEALRRYAAGNQHPDTLGRLPAPLARAAFARGGARAYWEFERESLAARRMSETHPMWVAICEVQLGNRDRAFELLGRAVAVKQSDIVFLKVDPLFDALREDPRLPALLKRIGLP